MAPLSANNSSFHTADTAADNGNIFLLLGLFDMVLLRLHGLGIQRATGKTHGIGQILGVGMTIRGREVEAAGMAANTGTNVLQALLDQLCDPLGVCQELTCNANAINAAFRNGLRTYFRLHTAGANYWDVHKLLNMRNIFQVTVLGHIHRRMCPIPGVIGTVIRVEHIVACILQILGCLFRLSHVPAYFRIDFARHSTFSEALHLGFYRIPQRNREILAASSLDGLHHFYREAVAVFKRTTVLIGTLVGPLHGELVQKITLMDSMNFYAVNARILAKLCGLGKGLNNLMDLLFGHLGSGDLRIPAGGQRRGTCQLMAGVQNRL